MKGKKLVSLVQPDGTLELKIQTVEIGDLNPDEVIVRVDAAPIHPSNLLILLAFADPASLESAHSVDGPALRGRIAEAWWPRLEKRIGKSMGAGNEGAGLVIDAGNNARYLVGKTVACLGRAMFADFVRVPADACHVLPDGVGAAEGAASLVNPLTALTMIETMRSEGHSALVHTAAASSLGRMLNRICIEDEIPLVNIVRKQEHADLLSRQGARHVCQSEAETFPQRLEEGLEETGATIAFDAIGGGRLIGQLLEAMEAVALRRLPHYSQYGSMSRKTVYVYGSLDSHPMTYQRAFDFSWRVEGWLLTPHYGALSQQRKAELWSRIATGLTSTFATEYSGSFSLEQALDPSNLRRYAQPVTGQKFLITPHAAN